MSVEWKVGCIRRANESDLILGSGIIYRIARVRTGLNAVIEWNTYSKRGKAFCYRPSVTESRLVLDE